VVKNEKKKRQEVDTTSWFIVYFRTPKRGSVPAALKSFLWIKEPKQELEYCKQKNT